jgi:hypothetical protein
VGKYGSKDSNIELKNLTFVLETHPYYENYFISGSEAGKVIIWDIHNGSIIKSFTETGIYHREPNLIDEIFDGKFSSWGKHFVMSSVSGTFSIYSIFEKESYLATPVEQFFHLDGLQDTTYNAYNEHQPNLCNFDRMKYPEQPPSPILGERTHSRTISTIEYNQNYNDRYQKCSKEWKFCENYAEEFAPYVFQSKYWYTTFIDRQAGDARFNDNNPNNNQENNNDNSDIDARNRQPVRDSLYYDPANDNFDRDSDEDFIIDQAPDRTSTRRTVRRTNYREPDVDMGDDEEEKNRQNLRSMRRK